MSIDYKRCPACGSKHTAAILYGMPGPEIFPEVESGKYVLGGCCIMINGPEYRCHECEHEWNRSEAIDAAYGKIQGLTFSTSGFWEGTFFVEMDFNTRKMKWGHIQGGDEDVYHKQIQCKTVDQIIEHMKWLDVLNWRKEYSEPVMDGTTWELALVRKERNIYKYGSNGFPEGWDEFYGLMKKYMRKTSPK
ncbi:hypothetical protein [Halobacillus yeomjeoni]|uniref:Uncharacterized protein n=1 Tax=Halobacillus yeomjeoni TaxID=311194 RepID=A0A931MWH7_9BACI|nr:hypothetical protein [Halobacillus yeomjeoni]MBH0231316.1 hypothetical protein [Halobacillus yeomjeoni]